MTFDLQHHVWHTFEYHYRHREDAVDQSEKVRENRLRRAADRQGLKLEKSRRRDPRATDYGTYMLTDPYTNTVVAMGLQSGYGMTLDEVEEQLNS